MSDTNVIPSVPRDESSSQAWVAFTIVIGIVIIVVVALIVGFKDMAVAPEAFTLAGTGIGILGNALMAPSGIGKVIAAAVGPKPPQ